jgi:hypothetical protein
VTVRSAELIIAAGVMVGGSGCHYLFQLDEVVESPLDGGCVSAECLTVIAEGETGATELLVDGAELFWTVRTGAGGIRACDVDACTPRSLTTPEVNPHSLVLDGALALWVAENRLMAVARDATEKTPTMLATNAFSLVAVRRVGQRLWRTSAQGLDRCDYNAMVPQCTASSGLPDPVGQLDGVLAVDPLDQLWGAHETDAVLAANVSPESATHRFAGPRINAIAVGSTHVFGLTANGTRVYVWSVSAPDGTQPIEIATGGTPMAIALDGRDLYVGEAEGNLVHVVVGDAGDAQSLRLVARLDRGIQGLALVADRVYVAADGTIGWVAR